jgi:hypothetical protein
MVTKLRQVLDERGVKLQWLTDKTGINGQVKTQCVLLQAVGTTV